MNLQQQYWIDGARQLTNIFAEANDINRLSLARLTLNRLALPQAYVTVVGETSTGKSSLINALLSQEILPVSAKPTTGIVTHIVCQDEPQPQYLAIYRDATQEPIDGQRFVALSLEPDRDILRLQARITPKTSSNIGLHIFDTPGYNAVLSQHEEVLMTFLPQSDVIVFVVGYRTGFGQIDQDLFEVVAAATAHDKEIPLVLVINRARLGCTATDKRVQEIQRLAEEGLKRKMALHIVSSANLPVSGAQVVRVPMIADDVWNAVRQLAFDPHRLKVTQSKLENELLKILDDANAAAEREEAELMANMEQRLEMKAALEIAQEAKNQSIVEIDKTMSALQSALPRLIARMADSVKERVMADISSSGKWLGEAECAEWIAGHSLPFEVRAIGRAIESHITTELDALNRRLEEIANTTVAELNKKVELSEEDPVRRFTKNLASTLMTRMAGNSINAMLRSLGGVGGVAAGAGNLAKMAVSRIGQLFGQTFSKEVYNQIGRTFSKKMVERLAIAAAVLIEVVSYINRATSWQDDLIKKLKEIMNEWREEITADLLNSHIPDIRSSNLNIIEDLYADTLTLTPEVSSSERNTRLMHIQIRRQRLYALRSILMANISK